MEPRLIDLSGLDRRPLAAWRQRGWWGRSPLWERVKEVAARDPAKPAVIDADHVLSYGALWHAALRQAQAMRRADVDRGDVILVQLPNGHEFVVLAVAAEIAGIVFAFCPIAWDARETQRALHLVRPRIWFTAAAPRRDQNRTALIAQARAVFPSLERPCDKARAGTMVGPVSHPRNRATRGGHTSQLSRALRRV